MANKDGDVNSAARGMIGPSAKPKAMDRLALSTEQTPFFRPTPVDPEVIPDRWHDRSLELPERWDGMS